MNQQWLDRLKARVLRMRYRQKGHESETPSDYFHRKLRYMQTVFTQTESEAIMEIMNNAPRYWSILIDTSQIHTIADLQYYIKYHEENLVRNPDTISQDLERRIKQLESRPPNRSSHAARTFEAEADTNFVKKRFFKKKPVGAHASFSNYKFLQNDKIVSKGKTPGQKGARPCRHCGSPNHWDFDHPMSGEGNRKANAFLTVLDDDALEAYAAYESCYLKDSDPDPDHTNPLPAIEEQEGPTELSGDEDFPSSLA